MDETKSAAELFEEMRKTVDAFFSKYTATDDDLELNTLVGGRTMRTHRKADCIGKYCTIHNNSDHHMVKWPQNWRGDRYLMERVCPHGIGHPDPDDPKADHPNEWVHGCDGCCNPKSQFLVDVQELSTDYEGEK